MPFYTEAEIQEQTNYKLVAYYNGVNLGVLSDESHNWRIVTNDVQIGSSLTGAENLNQISTGEKAEVELILSNVNKNRIYNVLVNKLAEAVATNINSPSAGALEHRANPKVEAKYPLVLYMLPGNVTAPTADDTSDNAIVFPKAVYNGDFEFMMSATEFTTITLTFHGFVDPANNNRSMYWGSGVDTDGTIT